MKLMNLFGYKFIDIHDPHTLCEELKCLCEQHQLLGTILLGTEGINFSLAGSEDHIKTWQQAFTQIPYFNDLFFKEWALENIPFDTLVVKVKNEIVTMGQNDVKPSEKQGQNITPEELLAWYETHKEFTLLDTRNTYEVKDGTFDDAIHLGITEFRQFPMAAKQLHPSLKKKPLVMFCTGGIRCEKASLELEKQGFEHVYQLEGGILNYFKHCQSQHYHGSCFVFDNRDSINAKA